MEYMNGNDSNHARKRNDTTISLSREARDLLQELADANLRSKAKHAELLIEQDYRRLKTRGQRRKS